MPRLYTCVDFLLSLRISIPVDCPWLCTSPQHPNIFIPQFRFYFVNVNISRLYFVLLFFFIKFFKKELETSIDPTVLESWDWTTLRSCWTKLGKNTCQVKRYQAPYILPTPVASSWKVRPWIWITIDMLYCFDLPLYVQQVVVYGRVPFDLTP